MLPCTTTSTELSGCRTIVDDYMVAAFSRVGVAAGQLYLGEESGKARARRGCARATRPGWEGQMTTMQTKGSGRALRARAAIVVAGLAIAATILFLTADQPSAMGAVATQRPQPQFAQQRAGATAGKDIPNTDPCGVFNVVSGPAYGPLYGVAAVSFDDVWAVGGSGIIHWDGAAWSAVSHPGVGTLRAVAAASTNDVWAVGNTNGSQTLIEHWNGSSWSVVSSPNPGSPNPNYLFGVAAVSTNDVWAVGTYCASGWCLYTLVEHWNGSAWSVVQSPNVYNSINTLQGVAAIAANDVWAVGYSNDGMSGYRTLTEHWNGTSWSMFPTPNPGSPNTNYLYGVAAVATNDVWAVGEYASGADQTLVVHWNGSAWSVVQSPNVPGSYSFLRGVSVVSARDIWAVGYSWSSTSGYRTLVEHWNGSTWSIVTSPNPGPATNQLNGVATSPNSVWAVGLMDSGMLVERLIPCAVGTPTATPTSTPFPTPARTPLVFIPGIGGSYLVDRANGENVELWPVAPLSYDRLSLFPADYPSSEIVATDILRRVTVPVLANEDIYETLINALTGQGPGQGHYVEYDGDTEPEHRTTGWCRDHRPTDNPTLFVFPYDWRKSNIESARALKEYIGCIQEIYPGTSVDILTHSMGGLVARRYILDNPGTHSVNKLITIASPWLGSANEISVLETGKPIPPVPIVPWVARYLTGSSTGAHELLPSRAYYELAGPPLAEDGWDLNGNGETHDPFSDPSQYLFVMSSRYGYDHYHNHTSWPGISADQFHSYSWAGNQQDNWQFDTTGVQYYHVYGIGNRLNTIVSLRARADDLVCLPGDRLCVTREHLDPVWGWGDDTVPLISAERKGPNPEQDYNAPNAGLIPVEQPSDSTEDDYYTHGGLVKNPTVLNQVIGILESTYNPSSGPSGASSPDRSQSPSAPVASPTPRPAAVAGHYLLLSGVRSVVVEDGLGNSTEPISGTLLGEVPGVASYPLGEDVEMVTLPARGAYTVTFQTITEPLAITLDTGDTVSNTQAIRYQDVSMPPGISSIITITGSLVSQLRYDADDNGTFETPVTPTVAVSGTTALDTEPPTIAVSPTVQGALTLITLTVSDEGSGVRDLFYSLDGTQYQPYSGTLTLYPDQTPILYIFADDNMANRSALDYSVPTPSLVGHVTWQGRPAQPSSLQELPVTLTLKLGSVEVSYPATTTDGSGFFTAHVGTLITGTYDWRAKSPKYLANSGSVILTGTVITNVEIGLMRVGDANDDNLVDAEDFNILKNTFGKVCWDEGYDDRADFSGDCLVDVVDFNLLKGNFGLGGAGPLGPGG